jgi:hypothetical protein
MGDPFTDEHAVCSHELGILLKHDDAIKAPGLANGIRVYNLKG